MLKRRKLLKMLSGVGYEIFRDVGSHTVLKRDGSRILIIPRHKELNELTAKSILKAAGLL